MLTRRTLLAASGLLLTPEILLAQDKKWKITESNIEGPFHRRGAPFRSKLADGLKGTPLSIRGKVLDIKGNPLKNAVVDIWHADKEGEYDNESKNFFLRGRIRTDKEGAYAYTTIMPGQYDLGEAKRPAHIHYKTSIEGYKSLTTQLYFKGDKWIKKDPFVRKSLIIPLTEKEKKLSGTFDIVLARA